MRAAVLRKLNAPLSIESLKIGELQFGQVLVKVHASGICGAQLGEISGAKGEDHYLPHLLGHEGGGEVLNIGIGVTKVKPGDRVVMHWRKGVGAEGPFPRYESLSKNDMVGGGHVTTFTEMAVVSENRLTPVGKDIPYSVAALMGCSITTAFGLINNEAKLKLGQSIAIAGCGGVGLNIIQGAKLVGGWPIVAIDNHQQKLFYAMECGASHVINSATNHISNSVRKMVGNVDVFVDCTGIPAIIESGYESISQNGKVILVGQPHADQNLVVHNFREHYLGKTMFDSQGGLTNPTVDIPRYLNLYREGKLNFDNIGIHHYSFDEINTALDDMRSSGRVGKCIIKIN